MVCSTATLAQMLLTRPNVLDPASSTDAWFELDAQLRAALDVPAERGSREATTSARSRTQKRQPLRSARSRRAAARRKKALRQFVLSLLLLAGFVAYGPQISTAVGGMLAEQLTKDLTPPSACDENSADGSTRAAAGQDQQGGRAGKSKEGKSQKEPASRSAAGEVESTETGGVAPDC
jgi:hypothetical protein